MRVRRYLISLGVLLTLGCSDLTSPRLLDGTWTQDEEIPGNSVQFTLTTSGDAVSGSGQWTGEACCGGPVAVSGDATGGDVRLSLSFVANGSVVPSFNATFAGRLINPNTLSGVIVRGSGSGSGSPAPVTYRRAAFAHP
jgi:hypothetical protein